MTRKKKFSELTDADLYHYRCKQDEKLFGEYMKERFANIDHEIHDKKNYLRDVWFRTRDDSMKGLMDFPTHEAVVGEDTCLVYDIPPERMQEALDKANPYKGELFFPVQYMNYSKAKILYVHGYNFIVHPCFFETGKPEIWGMDGEMLRKAIVFDYAKETETLLKKGTFVSLEHDNAFTTAGFTVSGKAYPAHGNAVIAAGGSCTKKMREIIKVLNLNRNPMTGCPSIQLDARFLKEFVQENPMIQSVIREKFGADISEWKLKNTRQITELHEMLTILNLNQIYGKILKDYIDLMPNDYRPNIIIDSVIDTYCSFLDLAGSLHLKNRYRAENIHVVWMLEDIQKAIARNRRSRCPIQEETLLAVLDSTAFVLRRLLDMSTGIREKMDGDFWLALNGCEMYQLKRAGEPMISYSEIDENIKNKIRKIIPDQTKYLWT